MTLSEGGDHVYNYQRWQLPSLDKAAQNDNLSGMSREKLDTLEEQARAKGFEIGKWEGLEAGKTEVQQRVGQLGEILDKVAKPLASIDHQVAQELVGLAMTIAQHLISKELSVQPEAVLAIVEEALAALPPDAGLQPVTVLMHPDDIALISEHIAVQSDKRGWQLVENPEIARGGCQVSTPDSFIDATLAKRCEGILAGLLEAEQQPDNRD